MSINNVRTQLQRAIEMRETAIQFAALLQVRMDDLEDTLESNVQMGFPEDIAQTYYQNYLLPDRSIINDLSEDMRTRHVQFLDKVIADLEDAARQV